jgi:ABC-type proline/glycine betaine transport system permease subunit
MTRSRHACVSCSHWSAFPPEQFADRWPDELSGGQRQRVGVARALAADPPVLLMDEPFGALDPVTRRQLHNEFRRIQARVGKCVILVTHDMVEARLLGDRVGVMERGRLIWCGPPTAIDASTDPVVRELSTRRVCRLHLHRQPREHLLRFWIDHRGELAVMLGEHVFLVAISTVIAAGLGVPLGVFAARRPRLATPFVAVANVVQTIPSLAMFGFLLPVPLLGGVGARAAVVALVFYALLPIVRSTIVGITSISASIRDVGVAMGMRSRDLLWQVELPLATPAIVGGIRVAASSASDRQRLRRRSEPADSASTSTAACRWSIRRSSSPARYQPRCSRSSSMARWSGSSGACRNGSGRARVVASRARHAAARHRHSRNGVASRTRHEHHRRRVEEFHGADHPRRDRRADDRARTVFRSSAG